MPLLACAPALAPGTPYVRDLRVQAATQPAAEHGDLEEKLATEESSFFGGKKAFDESKVAADAQRIATHYAERGFFEAQVRPEVNAEQEARDVRWVVTPGPMTRVVEVRLVGEDKIDEAMMAELRTRASVIDSGDRYDFEIYDKVKGTLEDLLESKGYAYASVVGRVFVDKARSEAIIEYVLRAGPLVYFGPVRISGNDGIPERAIRRELLVREGKRYDPELLTATEAQLYKLGVFSLARLSLTDPATQPASMQAEADIAAPIDLKVEVAKLHDLNFGGGIGIENRRQEVRARAEWRLRNFLGGMRTLEIAVRPAYAVIPTLWIPNRHGPQGEVQLTFTQPDIAASSLDFFISPSYQLGIQEAYQFHGPSLRLGFERPFWRRRIRPGIAYQLEYYTFFNIQQNLFNNALTPTGLGGIGVEGEAYRLAYLEQYVTLDLRDNILDPNKGFYADIRTEQGAQFVGGQFDYFKITPEIRGYVPIGERVVLAARVLFGVLFPLGNQDSPITRRYRLGGASSHRGFSVSRLSPQVEATPPTLTVDNETLGQSSVGEVDPFPIGANAEFLFSFDVRVRVLKLFGYWLSATAFLDAGDAPPSLSELDFRLLHYAVGPSLSFETPIGSIRAGIGFRLNRLGAQTEGRDNPDPGRFFAFQLSIGAAF